ncbi:serpin family protein [Methanogenium marinum]|uniref:Serpin family protein n=1 Tax=Methanogenium marinum TaxID=348610 RepID=A0A9Q4KW56_9EURY|nr:serpin family protein [Methanogenium marinum]MDE4908811.1 serpin family protein [Methanogenium marinum]
MKNQAFLLGAAVCLVLACTFFAGCTAPDEGPVEAPTETPTETPAEIPTETPTVLPGETPVGTPVATERSDDVVSANALFAYDLYHSLKSDDEYAEQNLFFSPYSISTALALTYEGAKGTTAEEIRSVFHFPADDTVRQEGYASLIAGLNRPDAAYSLSTANALWAEETYPFLPEYIETAQRYYAAEVRNMDFITAPDESRLTINEWVEDQTEDRIQDLIPAGAITPLTRLVITNAIYFKGTWVLQFDENKTHQAAFFTESGDSVLVDMMQRTDDNAIYPYAETDDLQILRMPYEHESGKALSMTVLLPKNKDITAAENALGTTELADAVSSMKPKQVEVFFPKFTLETTYFLPDTLGAMGMPTAFGSDADLSGMDNTRFLYITDVIHKAFVEVNEEGTEAAAATGVIVGRAVSVQEPVPVFRADHPFIFMITDDETGMLLFMGQVADPTV